jgi:hypothetical protein
MNSICHGFREHKKEQIPLVRDVVKRCRANKRKAE